MTLSLFEHALIEITFIGHKEAPKQCKRLLQIQILTLSSAHQHRLTPKFGQLRQPTNGNIESTKFCTRSHSFLAACLTI